MSKSLLNKINQDNFLSLLFSFLPRKKATKVTLINKKLSSELNLTIDEYLLKEEKYRKVILSSKGSINEICNKAFKFYRESDSNEIALPELMKNMIRYMKYLLNKKIFKYYLITFDYNISLLWSNISFILEVLRTLKKGISIELGGCIKYKYYDIIKDAILNLEEVHSVLSFPINPIKKSILNYKFYYDMFDWTKIRCIDFVRVTKFHQSRADLLKCIEIPDNANFRKIKINTNTKLHCNDFIPMMIKHGSHVEHLKIYYFNDLVVNTAFFKNFSNIKKVKLIQCFHLAFYNFLIFFRKYLSQIKVLFLDNIVEPEFNNLSEQKECFYIMQNVFPRLNNLEKLEINFTKISNICDTYKLLSRILVQNKDLKELKIGITFITKNKSLSFMENFIGKEASLREDSLKEFYSLIKEISSLKNLSNLELNFDMDDKMTQIVNTFLNVGKSLKNLTMTHTNKLNINQLLISHPNLNMINLCLKEKDAEDTKRKFNYEFAQRPWKSITLKNYPLNNSFIDALVKAKNSLNELTLENTFNACEKSTAELSNLLLAIKNCQI